MPSKVTKAVVEKFRDSLLRLHEKIIDVSGGEQGVRDIGGFEHAIYEIISCAERYGSKKPFLIAAKAYSLLATRHYFVDGNKRTSHIVAKLVLLEYGYVFRPAYSEAVEFILEIAGGNKSVEAIEDWIKDSASKVSTVNGYVRNLASDIEEMRAYADS